jgi:hypothetical protein
LCDYEALYTGRVSGQVYSNCIHLLDATPLTVKVAAAIELLVIQLRITRTVVGCGSEILQGYKHKEAEQALPEGKGGANTGMKNVMIRYKGNRANTRHSHRLRRKRVGL